MSESTPEQYETTLSTEDARVMDALVAQGFDTGAMPAEDEPRADRLLAHLHLLDRDGRAEEERETSGESLIAATLAVISRSTANVPAGDPVPVIHALNEDELHRREPIPFRLSDVLAVAASFVILVGVLGPVLSAARTQARCQSCRSRMMSAAYGFTAYAGDYQQALPVAYDAMPEGGWMSSNVGADNLFVLTANQYASLGSLGCPENPLAPTGWAAADREGWTDQEISFSYQNLFGASRPGWGDGRGPVAILSDRNPVLDGLRRGERPRSDANSPSHAGRGQNVLRTDGSVCLLRSNEDRGDNIWLPNELSASEPVLSGREVPSGRDDAMLIH